MPWRRALKIWKINNDRIMFLEVYPYFGFTFDLFLYRKGNIKYSAAQNIVGKTKYCDNQLATQYKPSRDHNSCLNCESKQGLYFTSLTFYYLNTALPLLMRLNYYCSRYKLVVSITFLLCFITFWSPWRIVLEFQSNRCLWIKIFCEFVILHCFLHYRK